MNKLGKIAPIVVILACAGSLFLAFMVAKKKAQHIAQIASLNGTLTATKAELSKAKGTLKQAQTDLTKTKGDLDQANATLATTKAALDQKTQEASSLLTQLTDVTNQLAQTKADLAAAQATRKNIEAGLDDDRYYERQQHRGASRQDRIHGGGERGSRQAAHWRCMRRTSS